MPLVIEGSAGGRIRAHGREAYPDECCGALYGTGGRVREILALPNVTEEGPRRRFRVSDADYQASEVQATELGLELLGFYHSHPDHPAVPSQYDLDHAWPNWSYVIVSIREGQAVDLRSWRLREDRSKFDEEAVVEGGDQS